MDRKKVDFDNKVIIFYFGFINSVLDITLCPYFLQIYTNMFMNEII